MAGSDGPARAAVAAAGQRSQADQVSSRSPTSLVLLCALPREASALCGAPLAIGAAQPLGAHAEVHVSGPGPAAARRAVAALSSQVDRSATLLGIGVAGALARDLAAGDVILGTALIDDQPSPPAAASLPAWVGDRLQRGGLRVRRGAILSTAAVVDTAEAKGEARKRWPTACAVDMESAAYAREAQRLGIAFASLRVIIDEAHMGIPCAATESLGADGETHLPTLLRSLLRHPSQLPSLMRLGKAWQRAQASLQVCGRVISQPDVHVR